MEILLVRHALPVRRELGVGEVADPELSEAGIAQAQRLTAYLHEEQLHAVYASPLRRARQTAAPLAADQGVEVRIEDDVAEFDRQHHEYVPMEELKAAGDPRWRQMIDGVPIEGAPPPEVFRVRLVDAVERIIAAHPGQKVAIVCHGGIINGYLAHILGITGEGGGFFYPNYTSISRVAAARSGERTLLSVNETAHLRGSGLPIGMNG